MRFVKSNVELFVGSVLCLKHVTLRCSNVVGEEIDGINTEY